MVPVPARAIPPQGPQLPTPSPSVSPSPSPVRRTALGVQGPRLVGKGSVATKVRARRSTPPNATSVARQARRRNDWTAVSVFDLREYASPQVTNVRKRSLTVHKKGRWTVDRVQPGKDGAPPSALRWCDPDTGLYTITRLTPQRKAGATRARLLMRNEVSVDTAAADIQWDATRRGARLGSSFEPPPCLEDKAAADYLLDEVVNKWYGCIWRDEQSRGAVPCGEL